MTKRTLASLGACALSALLLGGCPSDPGGGPMDSVDLAQVDAAGPEDMATSLPDLIGAAAPTKVTGFMQPASAFWDASTSAWYISNVVTTNITDPKSFRDSKAFISKVPANLMNPNHAWYPDTATAKLSAPFGMRVQGNKLYIGDIDKLWAIDIANPTTVPPIQSATVAAGGFAGLAGYPAFIIDVALDSTGNVYAADATGGRLLKWTAPFTSNSSPAVIVPADTFAGTSGIFVDGTNVIIAEAGVSQLGKTGGISTCNLDGSMRKRVVNSPQSMLAYQGIEKDGGKYLIASPGDKKVYSVDLASGQRTLVRDTAADGATTATDIGWDPVGRVLAVPDTSANVVYFYKL